MKRLISFFVLIVFVFVWSTSIAEDITFRGIPWGRARLRMYPDSKRDMMNPAGERDRLT